MLRRLLFLASSIVFLDTVFFAAIVPLLPTYAAEFDLTKTGAGVLAAAYPAGTFIGALPGGWLTARIGVRPTVVVGLTTLIAASLAFAFANSIVVLDVARFVQGLGGAASWAGAVGWLVAAGPRERRGELLGSAMAAAIVGALGGPVLGAAAVALGPEVVFSAVALAGVGLRCGRSAPPPMRQARRPRCASCWPRRAPRFAVAMWLIVMVGLMFGTLDVLAPLRLDELGATAAVIGATFLLAAALEAGESPFIGRLSDRHGRVCPPSWAWPPPACGRAAAVAGGDVAAGRRRARGGAEHRDPVDAVDGDALRRRGGPRPRAGLRRRAHQPRLVDRPDARLGRRRAAGEAYGDALPYLTLAGLCLLTLVLLTRPRYSAALAGK